MYVANCISLTLAIYDCVVTKGRTLLVITHVNSGFKKLHILIFSKYLPVKIASYMPI